VTKPEACAESIPLALYAHLPWCLRKCPYCDFNSHALIGDPPEAAYVARMLADFRIQRARAGSRPIRSLFIGGGTPSLFSPRAIGALLDGLDGLSADAEITLEANPGAADAARFAGYRAAGVNRLSIGVQSFDDRLLAGLGRVHDAAGAHAAFRAARASGFDNVNLDLMHGLPGQSLGTAMADLTQALDLAPEHLSWYELTLEPNTAFHAHPPKLPDEDSLAAIQDAGGERLAVAGYQRYEISAYARESRHRCRHNLNYWRFGDYLAIGAGAHGKLTHADGSVWRLALRRHPRGYLEASPEQAVSSQWRLAPRDLIVEYPLNALRLVDGTLLAEFPRRTGLPLARLSAPIARARALGLLEADPERLRPSPFGLRYLNDLINLFDCDDE